MPKEYIHTSIEGQKLKLSNLDKVLYPDVGIVKAQVIDYAMKIGNYLIPHLSNRPLTLIRYPDGIAKQKFYAKNKPKWTPKWVPSFKPSWDEGNTYIVVQQLPELVWLANLAALELHPMVIRINHPHNPDQFIIDLDPDEGINFEDLKNLSFEIKEHLEHYGYFPFVKTSGGKGLHIVTPLIPNNDFDIVIKSFKSILLPFIQERSDRTTLQVHKDKRKGKVLLDIYRNYQGNSCVAPYSLRGKPGAPVSMPITWEELKTIESPQAYHIGNVISTLEERGDVWKDMYKYAVDLHDKRLETSDAPIEKLKAYDAKRDLSKSPEPASSIDQAINGKYCIQLHDATNLHYDLRLGIDGVLKSWAIPKGFPSLPGIKRLCIQTEDHPPKYFDFEGVIPKDEYGGGEMWLFDQGTIHWHTQKETKYEFTLNGNHGSYKFHLYKIKDNQWLIERKDNPTNDWLAEGIKPMLSDSSKTLPSNRKYYFEIKWDGIRAMIYKRSNEIKIISRSGRDITKHFPDICLPDKIEVEELIADAEIVVLDAEGRPIFADVISRMHTVGDASIKALAKVKPAVCYFFDVLYLDGHLLTKEPASRRHAYLQPILKTNKHYRISDRFDDGKTLWAAAESMNLEGIMAKIKDAPYLPDQRSAYWLKIKFRSTVDCIVLGYTTGSGDREPYFGSLQLAEFVEDELVFRGRVGSGFDTNKLIKITELFRAIEADSKPINASVEEEKHTTWIQLKYYVEIEYASMTDNGTLREPVFKRMYTLGESGGRDYIVF